jgi:hypothetical protein
MEDEDNGILGSAPGPVHHAGRVLGPNWQTRKTPRSVSRQVSQQMVRRRKEPTSVLSHGGIPFWDASGVIEKEPDLVIANGSDLCQVNEWIGYAAGQQQQAVDLLDRVHPALENLGEVVAPADGRDTELAHSSSPMFTGGFRARPSEA